MRKPDSFRSQSASDKLLDIIVWVVVAFAVIVAAYPFLYVVSVAFSDGAATCTSSRWASRWIPSKWS